VGDALAGRVTGFDRRYILVLSRNPSPGPMSNKKGLPYELGVVDRFWTERRHFALLHDLTACLRIGDVTEFRSDGWRIIHEVKTDLRNARSAQTARMTAATRALNEGGQLPGSEESLVDLQIDLRTHVETLAAAIELARERGLQSMKVPGGRVLVAANVVTMATSDLYDDPMHWISAQEQERARVLRRAGIADHSHHLTMRTAEWAAQSPIAVPFGVYPMDAGDCADVICDFAIVETVMSPTELLQRARLRGYETELTLRPEHGSLVGAQPMFRLVKGDRALTVRAPLTHQLLAELIDLDTFLLAIDDLLEMSNPPPSPVITYRNEANVWR
jgi:hypothetical protein